MFRPTARDMNLRNAWKVENTNLSESGQDLPTAVAADYSFTIPPSLFASEKIVLLYVGRISWEKNLRLLVEACRGLEKPSADGTRPACQLVFVGDGPSRPELEVLCASYGLDAIFMGYRKGAELAAAYASADIFAFPSW